MVARLFRLDTDRAETAMPFVSHLRRERGCGGGRGAKRTPPALNTAAAPLAFVVVCSSNGVLLVARALRCALGVRWVGEVQALRCGGGRRTRSYDSAVRQQKEEDAVSYLYPRQSPKLGPRRKKLTVQHSSQTRGPGRSTMLLQIPILKSETPCAHTMCAVRFLSPVSLARQRNRAPGGGTPPAPRPRRDPPLSETISTQQTIDVFDLKILQRPIDGIPNDLGQVLHLGIHILGGDHQWLAFARQGLGVQPRHPRLLQ